jgi:hypothetical protein
MPISTTTNRASMDDAPRGSHTAKTESRVNMFIMTVALRGPSSRSESQGGRVLPNTAPLRGTYIDVVSAELALARHLHARPKLDWRERGDTYMLYDIIK